MSQEITFEMRDARLSLVKTMGVPDDDSHRIFVYSVTSADYAPFSAGEGNFSRSESTGQLEPTDPIAERMVDDETQFRYVEGLGSVSEVDRLRLYGKGILLAAKLPVSTLPDRTETRLHEVLCTIFNPVTVVDTTPLEAVNDADRRRGGQPNEIIGTQTVVSRKANSVGAGRIVQINYGGQKYQMPESMVDAIRAGKILPPYGLEGYFFNQDEQAAK